jgi:ABC-type amino acid transport substrate-binding protein
VTDPPSPEELALGEAIVAAFGKALAEAVATHGDQLLYGIMSGRVDLLVRHDGMFILEKDVDPHIELGTEDT